MYRDDNLTSDGKRLKSREIKYVRGVMMEMCLFSFRNEKVKWRVTPSTLSRKLRCYHVS
jgi:hypothetical protein